MENPVDFKSESMVAHELMHGWLHAKGFPKYVDAVVVNEMTPRLGNANAALHIYQEFVNYFMHLQIYGEEAKFNFFESSTAPADFRETQQEVQRHNRIPAQEVKRYNRIPTVDVSLRLMDIRRRSKSTGIEMETWLRSLQGGEQVIKLADDLDATWEKQQPGKIISISDGYRTGVNIILQYPMIITLAPLANHS